MAESKSKSKPAEPELVGVVNTLACVHNLAYTTSPSNVPASAQAKDVLVPRVPHAVVLYPGLNYAKAADLKAARAEDAQGVVADVDPTKLHPSQGMALAKQTASAPALRRWLGEEKNKATRGAIQRRLDTMRSPEDETEGDED